MKVAKDTVVEWYVVFCGSDSTHWLIRNCRKGFQHAYAVRLDCSGYYWMIVQPNVSHIDIEMKPVKDYPTVESLMYNESTIIPVTAKIDISKVNSTLGINSCVDVVKRLLGIKSYFVHSPYQLYKYLRRNDGQEDS